MIDLVSISSNKRSRLAAVLKARPGKNLEHGDHLLYHYALRCFCQRCGKLIRCWEDSDAAAEAECCGMFYKLLPWTVKVEVTDVSERPVLPPMDGSMYSDPDTDLKDHVEGGSGDVEARKTKPLSKAQKRLGR